MSTKDFEVTKDLQLNSITHGKVSLEETVKYIVDYLSVDTKAKYEIAIDTAVFIAEELKKYGINVLDKNSNIDFQVHMDIGTKGATAEFISELEGWVTAYSFKYKIKPESYASSTIADKLSK